MQRPKKLPRDANARAARIVAISTGEEPPKLIEKPREQVAETLELPQKNPAAVALGKLGGLKGGKARAKSLSKEKRAEIARIAAAARWKKS